MRSTVHARPGALLVPMFVLFVLLLLAGLIPAAAAQPAEAGSDEAGTAIVDEAPAAEPTEPAEGSTDDAVDDAASESAADDPVEGGEVPVEDVPDDGEAADGDAPEGDDTDADPVDTDTDTGADEDTDSGADAQTDTGTDTETDQPTGGAADAADETDADEVEPDATEEPVEAELAAAPEPEDIQVVEIDADAYCELLSELEGGIDDLALDELNGGGGVTAAPGTVLPAADTAAYRSLLEAIDTVLAGYADALLVNATYDGTVLVVTVVPDITECEGFEDLPLPEPVDDLDDVEVLVTVITEDDICEALSDVPEEPVAGEPVDPVDLEDVLEDLFDIRSGDDLDPDELADLTGLGEEIDAVLAGNPDSSTVSVTYDGTVLGIVLAPDVEDVLECEEPVEALPISSPAPADDDVEVEDGTEELAATGLDTPRQAGAGALAVLLGALLVLAGGRRRYQGAHVGR